MFTGIVEDLGEIVTVEHQGDSARVHVRSATIVADARIGDSIAVNGVCLTVTGFLDGPPGGFIVDVMGETLRLTSLKDIVPGTRVNLERPVKVTDRLGGHLVQGHVDGTGAILSRAPRDRWEAVRISLPGDLSRYVAHKGSITVDGISLTVSGLGEGASAGAGTGTGTESAGTGNETNWFEVGLIPETLKRTTLGVKQPGDVVNLEVDVIAKYVEKLLGGNR